MASDQRYRALLEEGAESVEQTRKRLYQALDRFENDQLIILPPGSKLTVRNFASEAGVSKDTALSRYRKGHPKAGQYRFPEVVSRFNELKKKGNLYQQANQRT